MLNKEEKRKVVEGFRLLIGDNLKDLNGSLGHGDVEEREYLESKLRRTKDAIELIAASGLVSKKIFKDYKDRYNDLCSTYLNREDRL